MGLGRNSQRTKLHSSARYFQIKKLIRIHWRDSGRISQKNMIERRDPSNVGNACANARGIKYAIVNVQNTLTGNVKKEKTSLMRKMMMTKIRRRIQKHLSCCMVQVNINQISKVVLMINKYLLPIILLCKESHFICSNRAKPKD